jgi:hypothetical protein
MAAAAASKRMHARISKRGRRRGDVCGGVVNARRHRRCSSDCRRARAAGAGTAAALPPAAWNRGGVARRVAAGGAALPLLRQAAAVGGHEVAKAASKRLFGLLVLHALRGRLVAALALHAPPVETQRARASIRARGSKGREAQVRHTHSAQTTQRDRRTS